MTNSVNPLVSIGVPVRNGGVLLEEAIECLIQQTYSNIEIIISDNRSSDETSVLCKRYEQKDRRIRYYRQDNDITALQNFRFTVERSTGDYFMWAAHDDRHSADYVEALLAKMISSPQASLVFSEVAIFSDPAAWRDAAPIDYPFEYDPGGDFWATIVNRAYIRPGYLHIYGLLRRQLLLDYNWIEIDTAGDKAMLFYLSRRGSFVRASGACFYCYKPIAKKTLNERANANSHRNLKPFSKIRLNWVCAKAGCHAERLEGRQRNILVVFFLFYYTVLHKRLKRIYGFGLSIIRRLQRLFGKTVGYEKP